MNVPVYLLASTPSSTSSDWAPRENQVEKLLVWRRRPDEAVKEGGPADLREGSVVSERVVRGA